MKNANLFDYLFFVVLLIGVVMVYPYAVLFTFLVILSCRFCRLKPLKKYFISRKYQDEFENTEHWAKRHGFHYIGMFEVKPGAVAVWENAEKSTFLTMYLMESDNVKFNTFFDASLELETSNKSEQILLPHQPGYYEQIFPDKDLINLWERHLAMESWLIREENVTLTPFLEKFPWGDVPSESVDPKTVWSAPRVALPLSIRTQGRFLLRSWTLPFTLPFTMLYRYCFWRKRTVKQLIESGKLVAPKDLPPDYKKYVAAWPPENVAKNIEIRKDRIPTYGDENLPRPEARSAYVRLVEILIVVAIIGTLFGLLFSAIHVPGATEETIALQKEFRRRLFEFDDQAALATADRIRQAYYREEAYADTAWQQAETRRFDACRETMNNIVGKYRRYHSPPIRPIMIRHLALALAASDRFDEADAALDGVWIDSQTAAKICRYYLAAGQTDRALALLEKSDKDDEYCKTLREIVAKYVRQGAFDKALDLAGKIEADGWRNASLREIVRESLIRDELENAKKTFEHFDLFRYRQQAAALLMVWCLERKEVGDAWKAFEQDTVDEKENQRVEKLNAEKRPDGFENWKSYNAIRQKLPYSRDDWRQIASEIFVRCGYTEEAKRIHGFVPSSSNVEKIVVEASSLPTKEDIRQRLDAGMTTLRKSYLYQHSEQERQFAEQLSTVSSQWSRGNEEAAAEALDRCQEFCRDLPLPDPFYPKYGQESRMKKLSVVFDAEILLDRFADAEKTIARIGVTETLENAVLHTRLATALSAARQRAEAQHHAETALKFIRRIDAAIPPDDSAGTLHWPQNVPEIVLLPTLLDSLELSGEAAEIRNRFTPPPRLRLLRFYEDTRFTFQ